jgi:antitoxin (DNA-binding transcriptional repressor) of toxin-antitoxin stability system
VICKRNRPVAELRAVEQKRIAPRPIGGATGVVIPPSFFEPLPDEFLDAFYNGDVFPQPAPSEATRPRPRRRSRGHK